VKLLTEPEAAALLRVSVRTLRDIRRRREIHYVALSARKIAYRPEDIEEYIAARRRLAPEPARNVPPPRRGRAKTPPANGNVVPFSQRAKGHG
jgi:hypothetical protein